METDILPSSVRGPYLHAASGHSDNIQLHFSRNIHSYMEEKHHDTMTVSDLAHQGHFPT